MSSNDDASRLTAALSNLITAVARVTAACTPTTDGDRPEYVSARALGIPARTLRRLVADGEVSGSLIGREIFVRRVDWDAYVASQRVAPRGERPARARNGMSADMQRVIDSGLGMVS